MGNAVPCVGDDEMTALRRAAAMAHTVAGIAVTLRSDGRILGTVVPSTDRQQPHPLDTSHPSTTADHGVLMSPCGFRTAVAKAWADHSAGQRVALVGQRAGGLSVDWSLRQPGALLGFGGVRTHCAGRFVWAMSSPLPAETLTAVLEDRDGPSPSGMIRAEGFEARMVRDELLDVSIVHVEAERASRWLVTAIDEVIRRFVAAAATAELLDALAPNP